MVIYEKAEAVVTTLFCTSAAAVIYKPSRVKFYDANWIGGLDLEIESPRRVGGVNNIDSLLKIWWW